jgi:hypothetical protein
MNIRVPIIAIAAASTAAIAAAQPAKDGQPSEATKPAPQVPIVLASAGDARRPSPAGAEGSSQPARRPAPRVTTCRCGDPQPEQEQDQQPDE